MAETTRFRQLVEREAVLSQTFLPSPADLSATGEYDLPVRDRARAYQLLMHAEIESYLEDSVTAVCIAAHEKWKIERRVTRTLLGMVTSYEKEMKGPRKVEGNFIDWMIKNAYEQQRARISGNHGIKQSNLHNLLFPAGLLDDEIDSVLLATLDAFGGQRGNTAHKSVGGVTKEIDPKTERDTVQVIIDGLRVLDEKFSILCA